MGTKKRLNKEDMIDIYKTTNEIKNLLFIFSLHYEEDISEEWGN